MMNKYIRNIYFTYILKKVLCNLSAFKKNVRVCVHKIGKEFISLYLPSTRIAPYLVSLNAGSFIFSVLFFFRLW
jgi:hypothetical protein